MYDKQQILINLEQNIKLLLGLEKQLRNKKMTQYEQYQTSNQIVLLVDNLREVMAGLKALSQEEKQLLAHYQGLCDTVHSKVKRIKNRNYQHSRKAEHSQPMDQTQLQQSLHFEEYLGDSDVYASLAQQVQTAQQMTQEMAQMVHQHQEHIDAIEQHAQETTHTTELVVDQLKEANKKAMNTRKHKIRAFFSMLGLVVGKLTGGLVGGGLGAAAGGAMGQGVGQGMEQRMERQVRRHMN